jgi:hypothetical protein
MSAIDDYIKLTNELTGLNRYFIGRIEDLKTVYIAHLHAEDTAFLGAYTHLEDARGRCERKAGQVMQWFDNEDWCHAADGAGNGYVIIQVRVNADYDKP